MKSRLLIQSNKLLLKFVIALLFLLLMVVSTFAHGDEDHTQAGDVILADHAADVVLLSTLRGHLEAVRDVTFTPNSNYLVSGGEDLAVKIWHIASGTAIYSKESHAGYVTDVDLTILADGNWLLGSVGWDRVAVFDRVLSDAPANVGQERVFEGANAVLNHASFSPDGTQYAFTAGTGVVFLLQGDEAQRLNLDAQEGSALAFSPDGRWLAAAAGFPSTGAWLFDLESADTQPILHLPYESVVTGLAFDPAQDKAPFRLAMVSDDGTLLLWELGESPVALGSAQQAGNWYMGLAYHPSGELIATATLEGKIELWDVRDPQAPQRLTVLDGHDETPVYAVAFSPDGTLLASAGGDRTIRLWGLPLAD